jgi:hypothetical protein
MLIGIKNANPVFNSTYAKVFVKNSLINQVINENFYTKEHLSSLNCQLGYGNLSFSVLQSYTNAAQIEHQILLLQLL